MGKFKGAPKIYKRGIPKGGIKKYIFGRFFI
jgi:hypothetical protein